jgi:hypothetical protein
MSTPFGNVKDPQKRRKYILQRAKILRDNALVMKAMVITNPKTKAYFDKRSLWERLWNGS